MNQKEIKKVQKRIEEIWEEMEQVIEGTGVAGLIAELVELEIQLEAESNK